MAEKSENLHQSYSHEQVDRCLAPEADLAPNMLSNTDPIGRTIHSTMYPSNSIFTALFILPDS